MWWIRLTGCVWNIRTRSLSREIKQRKDYWSSDYQDRRLLRLDAANPAINWSFAVFMTAELLSPATTERQPVGVAPETRPGRITRTRQRHQDLPSRKQYQEPPWWRLSSVTTLSIQSICSQGGRQGAIEVGSQSAGLSASPLPPTAETRHSRQTFSQSNGRFWKNWGKLAAIYQEHSVLCSSLIINIWENSVWNF